jgi:hypothetical protein
LAIRRNPLLIESTAMTTPAHEVTADFINRLKANGKIAAGKAGLDLAYGTAGGAAAGSPGRAVGTAMGMKARWEWFYQQVRNSGPWDFKNNVYKKFKATGVVICGRNYGNDMPGNFHFGFVGRAAGFASVTLQAGAGAAQVKAGTSDRKFWCTYGDDPTDNDFIRLGISLFDSVGLKVTQTNLKAILTKANPVTCWTP